MPVKVQIPTPMREQTGGNAEVAVSGGTVKAALDDLVRQYPGLQSKLFDNGKLRPYVNVFVNDEDIRYLDELNTAVKDGQIWPSFPPWRAGEPWPTNPPSPTKRPTARRCLPAHPAGTRRPSALAGGPSRLRLPRRLGSGRVESGRRRGSDELSRQLLAAVHGRAASPSQGGHDGLAGFAKSEGGPSSTCTFSRISSKKTESNRASGGREAPDSPDHLQESGALRAPLSMKDLERYSRQMRFPGIGKAGQEKLLVSRVTLCGCGALGTVLANALVRAGVGFLRIVDRDFIERHNLQRQVLFDEHDVDRTICPRPRPPRSNCADQLHRHVEPVVTDIDRTNILDLCQRRRPDPRRHRQFRDPLPHQRRGGEAGQAVGLRRLRSAATGRR